MASASMWTSPRAQPGLLKNIPEITLFLYNLGSYSLIKPYWALRASLHSPELSEKNKADWPRPPDRTASTAFVYGPFCWILVGSVPWAPIWYMVYKWCVVGSRLGAHTKENPWTLSRAPL